MYYQICNEECAVSSTEKGTYRSHVVHVDANDQKKISMHKWSLINRVNKKTNLFQLTVTSGVRTEAISPSHRHRHDTISEL